MLRLYLLISYVTANHIRTSSLPNLSLIQSGSSYYCTITNDSLGSALSWDYQNTDNTPSSNVYCNFDGNYTCTLKSSRNRAWRWIDDKNVSIILDYRWEHFNVLNLEYYPTKVYETNEENFRISFSVQVQEVHILLCDSDNSLYYVRLSNYGNCYWISLGANGGEKNYIRKCVAGAIPIKAHEYPDDVNCAYRQVEFTGNVTSETQWNHFTVLKQRNTVTVWKYGRSKPILNYTDRSHKVFTTKYVLVKRYSSYDAFFMKIYDVKTLTTNEPSTAITIQLNGNNAVETNCLALYVKSCKSCSFDVNLSSRDKVLKQMTTESLEDDWQEILLQDENNFTEIDEITFRTNSQIHDTEELYWHISNTIRKCGNTDFAMKKGYRDGCCYALKYPDQKICTATIENRAIEGDWICPVNTIGKGCIPCTSIPGRKKCEYSKMCELTSNGTVCSCGPGYQGRNCQHKCPSGWYGVNCRMECGRCVGTCNNIDGTCSSCPRNFESAICQTAILPFLKNAPIINKIGHTSVTILTDMEYEGKEQPYYYGILYQENRGVWVQHGQLMTYQVGRRSHIVNYLKPSTKYKIKILLQISNLSNYDGNYVPEAEFETTCADIARDILQKKVTNTSITLKVDVNKPQYKETCSLSQFRLFVYEFGRRIYILYDKELKIENSIEALKPYTLYLIEIRRYNVNILSTILRTIQLGPGPVQNVVHVSTNTTVSFKWDNPLIKNGYITEYRIQYQHLRYRMCDTYVYSRSPETITNATNTSIIISNLLPFSNYVFKIWAVTEYDGEPKGIFDQTKETSSPSEDEFPNLSFTTSNKKLNVMMTWDCEKLKGPLRFRAELICRSEWCFNRIQNYHGGSIWENDEKSEPKMQFQKIGKTEYVLKFFISRNNDEIFSTKRFTTGQSAPGLVRNVTVYSKNSTSASIRWLPPYPPEGDVESYWVYYSVYNWQRSVEMKIEKTAFCKLWPEYVCVTITGLGEHRWYMFQIGAKNMDVSEKGQTITESAYTEEQAPEAPQNMTLQWDNWYGLKVTWQHPDITNGVLHEFLLYINDGNAVSYPVTEENLQYQHKMSISEKFTLQKLKIRIAARNSAGISPIITGSIFAPPKTPKFVENPNIDDIKVTSFTINIPEISNVEGESSKMYIIITNTQNHDFERENSAERKLFKEIGMELNNSWTVGEFDLKVSKNIDGFNFNVGKETETASNVDSSWKLNNRKLEIGTAYNVSIILNNTFRDLVRYSVYTLNCTVLQSENESGSYLFVLLLIPLLLLCIGGVLYKKRKNINILPESVITLQQLGRRRNSNDVPLRSPVSMNELISENINNSKDVLLKFSKPVRITDLNKYISNSIVTRALEKEYQLIYQDKGKTSNHTIKTNHDGNRVKLQNADKKSSKNGIDANYIDGYNSQKAYIATVLPDIKSINKFWQMIWQENVEYIVLLTNSAQVEKKEIEKYWPDLKTIRNFDNIKVQLNYVQILPNYHVRYFSVSFNENQRNVQQFHYLTWPDYAIPSEVYKLTPFLKKVLTIPRGRPPIVVHSRGDVEYSCTLILYDIGLQMVASENKIDVLYHSYKILQQRDRMIGNIEQYKLVHLALLESIAIQNTGIVYDEFMKENIEIRMNDMIEEEMKHLDHFSWQHELKFTSNSDPNSDAESDDYLVPLNILADQSSKSLNPIPVDSFLVPAKFIVSRYPLNDTIEDFWSLVDEKRITVIICLNQFEFRDKANCKFFPTSSEYPLVPAPHLEVKYIGMDVKPHYVVYILTMTRQDGYQGNDTTIKLMCLQNWPSNMLHPENTIDLVITYEELNKLGRKSDTVLVTCSDGTRASGLFVAMCFMMDKLKVEKICDICLAVRIVRYSRIGFVRAKEQFSFLYRCALEYIHHFGLYWTLEN